MEFLSDRHSDRTSYTTTDDTYFLDTFCMCGNAQRTDKVLQGIAFGFVIEFFGRTADDLENDLDCSLFRISSGYSQRDSFAIFVNS